MAAPSTLKLEVPSNMKFMAFCKICRAFVVSEKFSRAFYDLSAQRSAKHGLMYYGIWCQNEGGKHFCPIGPNEIDPKPNL
jgi:hypothetical protein